MLYNEINKKPGIYKVRGYNTLYCHIPNNGRGLYLQLNPKEVAMPIESSPEFDPAPEMCLNLSRKAEPPTIYNWAAMLEKPGVYSPVDASYHTFISFGGSVYCIMRNVKGEAELSKVSNWEKYNFTLVKELT